MGLDFNNSKAHWSYSGFNRFREKLASEIGVFLPFMEGFWNPGENSMSIIDVTKRLVGEKTIKENFFWLPQKPFKWDNIDDPIVDLLYHSDCDGELTYEECEKIAPRLRELVKNWDDDDYDKKQALLLVEGMENCVKEKVSLEFC